MIRESHSFTIQGKPPDLSRRRHKEFFVLKKQQKTTASCFVHSLIKESLLKKYTPFYQCLFVFFLSCLCSHFIAHLICSPIADILLDKFRPPWLTYRRIVPGRIMELLEVRCLTLINKVFLIFFVPCRLKRRTAFNRYRCRVIIKNTNFAMSLHRCCLRCYTKRPLNPANEFDRGFLGLLDELVTLKISIHVFFRFCLNRQKPGGGGGGGVPPPPPPPPTDPMRNSAIP
jgi:hypothetical protein